MEEKLTLDALLAGIASDDADERTSAWQAAGSLGAAAIKPLAAVMRKTESQIAQLAPQVAKLNALPKKDKEARAGLDAKNKELAQALESGRAAKRALWQIVRTVGAPGPARRKKGVVARLLDLVNEKTQPTSVRREAFWMLSEIGGDETVEALCKCPGILANKELREDMRCMLERIPGPAAVKALEGALKDAPDDFKINVAQSLRVRGVEVPGFPCQKLVPTKPTSVTPVGR